MSAVWEAPAKMRVSEPEIALLSLMGQQATLLEPINAKMKVAMKTGRNTDIARSAADDLERLAGEG